MKLIKLFSILLTAILMCGCRSDDPLKKITFADSPEMFNFVTSTSRTTPFVTDGVSYDITFDDDKKEATITINNLRTEPGAQGTIVTFSNVKWNYVEGSHEKQRAITATSMTSDNPGCDITLTDVNIIYSESNELSQAPTAGFYAAYTMNGIYNVLSYPYTVYADGTTTVRTDPSVMPQLVDYDPVYILNLHPSTMLMDIKVKNLEIDGRKIDFSITGLAMTLTDDGYTVKHGATTSVVTSNGVTARISDLQGNADLRDEFDLRLEMVYEGTTYYVEAYLAPDYNKFRK